MDETQIVILINYGLMGVVLVLLLGGWIQIGSRSPERQQQRRQDRLLARLRSLQKAGEYEHEFQMLPHTDPDIISVCWVCEGHYTKIEPRS